MVSELTPPGQLPPPPPPIKSDKTLAEKTYLYWEVMLLRRGRHAGEMLALSIHEAFEVLRLIRDNTDPTRQLAILADELRFEIVMFGGSSKKRKKKKAKKKKGDTNVNS